MNLKDELCIHGNKFIQIIINIKIQIGGIKNEYYKN